LIIIFISSVSATVSPNVIDCLANRDAGIFTKVRNNPYLLEIILRYMS